MTARQRAALLRTIVAVALIAATVLLVGQFVPFFATVANLENVMSQAAILSVVAFGMTVVVVTGGIDLSVGGIMSLVGVTEVALVGGGVPWPAAIAVGLGVGALVGSVNAIIVSRLKLPPFIATFGTLGIAAGLALYLADLVGRPILPPDFVSMGNDGILGLPYLVMLAVGILVVLEVIWRGTSWGVHLRATGDNLAVTRLSGVPVGRVLTSAYVVSGLTAATAGTMLAARLGTASPLQGEPFTLSAVAACVIGGADLLGGRGYIWAAGAGAVFLVSIRNILNLQGVQPFMQDFVTGLLIILAVLITIQGPMLREVLGSVLRRAQRGLVA